MSNIVTFRKGETKIGANRFIGWFLCLNNKIDKKYAVFKSMAEIDSLGEFKYYYMVYANDFIRLKPGIIEGWSNLSDAKHVLVKLYNEQHNLQEA